MILESIILSIGIMLAFGFIGGMITDRLRLTTIVGYIAVGIILGPVIHLVELTPHVVNTITSFTLAFVAFIIGRSFTIDFLKKMGKAVSIILFCESFAAFAIVTIGIYLLTHDLVLALLLGSLAPATAPAGTIATIHNCKAKGNLSRITTAIVGLDDAVAVIIFVAAIAIVKVMLGSYPSLSTTIIAPLIEIVGAIILGITIGVVFAYVAKIMRERENLFIISLAAVLICAGLSELFGISLILACMFLGATLTNLAPNVSKTSFDIIENILPPIYIIFFIMAGLQLRPDLLIKMGTVGLIYIGCRIIGKMGGAFLGSKLARAEPVIQKYLGFALFSQAGVAIGLASMVVGELSAYGEIGQYLGSLAITVITATTVVFEIIGPIGIRYAVGKAGEMKKYKSFEDYDRG